jgi:ribosomal protein S18 acetylase RimI-like enzyme
MNLTSFVPGFLKKEIPSALTVRVSDFNLLAQKPGAIRKLRRLTLHSGSGMNYELDNLLSLAKQRPVSCKILRAYQEKSLVGWAFLSKEKSDFNFANTDDGYNVIQGVLFEVYVDPDHRRKGVGTKLIEVAQRKCGTQRICICPWDSSSRLFYNNFKKYNPKVL